MSTTQLTDVAFVPEYIAFPTKKKRQQGSLVVSDQAIQVIGGTLTITINDITHMAKLRPWVVIWYTDAAGQPAQIMLSHHPQGGRFQEGPVWEALQEFPAFSIFPCRVPYRAFSDFADMATSWWRIGLTPLTRPAIVVLKRGEGIRLLRPEAGGMARLEAIPQYEVYRLATEQIQHIGRKPMRVATQLKSIFKPAGIWALVIAILMIALTVLFPDKASPGMPMGMEWGQWISMLLALSLGLPLLFSFMALLSVRSLEEFVLKLTNNESRGIAVNPGTADLFARKLHDCGCRIIHM